MNLASTPRRIDPPVLFGLAALAIVGLLGLGRVPGAGHLFVAPWEKVAHIAVFGGLAFLVVSGFHGARLLLSFAIVALAGATDEAHQWFVPGRHSDWGDLGADVLAAAAGVIGSKAIWQHDEVGNGR